MADEPTNPTRYSAYRESFIRGMLEVAKQLERDLDKIREDLPRVIRHMEVIADTLAHPEQLPEEPTKHGSPSETESGN